MHPKVGWKTHRRVEFVTAFGTQPFISGSKTYIQSLIIINNFTPYNYIAIIFFSALPYPFRCLGQI